MLSPLGVQHGQRSTLLEAGRLVDGINIWSDFPSPGAGGLRPFPLQQTLRRRPNL